MFKFPWTIKRKAENKSDRRIEQIIEILFPRLELFSEFDDKGNKIKFHVDRAVDSNLDAVLMDLQEGHNDQACHETLNDAIKRLSRVRRILQVYADFDREAQYIIVENEADTRRNDDIQADDYTL